MKINYIMTTSDRWNAVLKLEIQHPSYIETLYGHKWLARLKALDNIVEPSDIAEYEMNLKMTDELWNNKNKKSK